MPLTEAYTYLFSDILLTVLAVPLRSELVLTVMRAFGTYDMTLVFVITLSAAIIANCANWWLGRAGLSLIKNEAELRKQGDYGKVMALLARYSFPALLFSPLPIIGPLVVVATGYIGFTFRSSLILSSAAHAVWWGYWCFVG